VLALVLVSARAQADGAFPDSLGIFVPADRAADIVLATNFGLITTTDDGASWRWVCEHGAGTLASLYQRAAPPSQRVVAVAPAGLVVTDDAGCTWSLASDLSAQGTVTDAFADPIDPARVLALAAFIDGDGQARTGLFVSSDGGTSFAPPSYVSSPDWTLVSVEAAASDPDRLYLTAHRAIGGTPGSHLLRSDDGGATWRETDITAVSADRVARIAAVDPVDPQKLYLRLTGTDDAIAVSTDGGATLRLSLVVDTQLTALLRRANGDILVSGLGLVDGVLYRSTDGAASFATTQTTLRIRAMAERAGAIYVATDNVLDGFALGVSADDGLTFRPVLKFAQVAGTRMCEGLASACDATCAMLVALGTFAASACQTTPGAADGGTAVGLPPDEGCGCTVGARSPRSAAVAVATLAAGLFAMLSLRRRRSRR
jgi:photosystem II stability/assembly factor-like uncharacterized protein